MGQAALRRPATGGQLPTHEGRAPSPSQRFGRVRRWWRAGAIGAGLGARGATPAPGRRATQSGRGLSRIAPLDRAVHRAGLTGRSQPTPMSDRPPYRGGLACGTECGRRVEPQRAAARVGPVAWTLALAPARRLADLDDQQHVALRVAQPEHWWHRAAHAADLGVDVHTRGLELSVEGVDIVGLQADA